MLSQEARDRMLSVLPTEVNDCVNNVGGKCSAVNDGGEKPFYADTNGNCKLPQAYAQEPFTREIGCNRYRMRPPQKPIA